MSVICVAEKSSERARLAILFAIDPHFLLPHPKKETLYILSTSMAWGVTCIFFDFCKRKKNETGIRAFQVNILLVCHSYMTTMQSWSLRLLHQAITCSQGNRPSLWLDDSLLISRYHLNVVLKKRHARMLSGKHFTCCHLSLLWWVLHIVSLIT